MMFQSKKAKQAQEDVESLTEIIAHLKAQMTDLQNAVKTQNALIQKQQALLKDSNAQHKEAVNHILTQGKELEIHNDVVAREAHNLNATRVTIEKTAIERIKQQVHTTLQRIEQDLSINTQQVERLSDELSSFREELKKAKASTARLSAAANTIKDADLAIKNHAVALHDADHEKLKLMKRVDELESMIAKFKRGSRHSQRRV